MDFIYGVSNMSEKKDKKIEYIKETKALFLIIGSVLGLLLVKTDMIFIFSIIVSLVLLLTKIFILENELSISKVLFNVFIAFYNVLSLFFMVQYFKSTDIDNKLYEIALKPFFVDGKYLIFYIIWIFILTLFVLLMDLKFDRPSGETYDR